MTHARLSAHRAIPALVILSAAGLAACNASASGSPAPATAAAVIPSAAESATTPSATPAASASDAPEPSEVAGATAVPTTINPCDLVTASEASALTGATFASGQVSTTENHGRLCAYGQQGVVFQVFVVVAPDAATAKKQEPAFKAELEKGASEAGISDLKLTELPEFQPGVDAAVVSGSVKAGGLSVKAIALYALKGAVLVAISDVSIGGSVPTSQAMQDQAKITLGRLP
jgi:hypothetical protein